MTSSYNVTTKTSQDYFFKKINESHPTILKNIVLREKLKKAHNLFYSFLKNELFQLFFIKNVHNFIQEKFEKKEVFFYLKTQNIDKVLTVHGKKLKFSEKNILNVIDERKTTQAFTANLIHSSDAELARYIILKSDCITIHDAFQVSIYELHTVMDEMNAFFNSKIQFHKTFYSIHILS